MRDRDRLFIFCPITNQLRVWDTDVNHCCAMQILLLWLQTQFSLLNSWLGTAVNKISSISGFSFTTNNDINYYTLFAWIALHIYPYLMYLLVLTIGFLFKKIRLEINQLVGCCKLQYVLGKKECSVCVEISVDKNIR